MIKESSAVYILANFRTTKRWFQKFHSGDESLENETKGTHRSVIKNDQFNVVVVPNSKTTVRNLS